MDRRDQTQYKLMNRDNPEPNLQRFKMQDGGIWSVKTDYNTSCTRTAALPLTGHKLRIYLQRHGLN